MLALAVIPLLGQYGPDPAGIPASFKCGWRKLAFEYGSALRPDATALIRDALDLQSYCGLSNMITTEGTAVHEPEGTSAPLDVTAAANPAQPTGNVVFVNGLHGDDSAEGSDSHPLRTVQEGVRRMRQVKGPRSVIVRAGTYYGPLLELTPADSELTIAAAANEEVWLSGGVLLEQVALLTATMTCFIAGTSSA